MTKHFLPAELVPSVVVDKAESFLLVEIRISKKRWSDQGEAAHLGVEEFDVPRSTWPPLHPRTRVILSIHFSTKTQ